MFPNSYRWVFIITLLISLFTTVQAEEETTIPPIETFAGVYMASDPSGVIPPWYLSVHFNGENIMIVDVSQHLDFLRQSLYITEQEYEDKIQVSAADRTFYGKYALLNSSNDESRLYYHAGVNPLLPVGERASTASNRFSGIPLVDDELWSSYETGLFFYVAFGVTIKSELSEKEYVMRLMRYQGILDFSIPYYTSPLQGFTKIF